MLGCAPRARRRTRSCHGIPALPMPVRPPRRPLPTDLASALLAGLLAFASLLCAPSAAEASTTLEDEVRAAFSLLDSGDIQGADDAFRALADTAGDVPAVIVGYAAVAGARGDWARARALVDGLTEDDAHPLAWTLRCRAELALGRASQAVLSCDRAMTLEPEEPAPAIAACAAALALWRWSTAERWCTEATRRAPDHGRSWWRRGIAEGRRGQAASARSSCDRAVALAPDDPMSHYCRGALALEQHQPSAALEPCTAATRTDAEHALGHYCLGMARLGTGDTNAAREHCSRAVALAPREALGHYCLGRIAREAGAWQDAERYLEEALRHNDALDEARGTLGDVFTRSGRLDEGEAILRALVERDQDPERMAQLAHNLLLQQRFDDAIPLWERALSSRPAEAGWRNNLAHARMGAGDMAGYVAELRAAAEADPADARILGNLVTALLRARDIPGAIEVATAGAARHPRDGAVATAACDALVRGQRWPDAVEACSRAAALQPGDAAPRRLLGVAHLQQGDATAAEVALQAAVDAGAQDPLTLMNLGNALMRLNRDTDAIPVLRRAVASADAPAQAHHMLGVALEATGDNSGARSAYCRARQLAPDDARFERACTTGSAR